MSNATKPDQPLVPKTESLRRDLADFQNQQQDFRDALERATKKVSTTTPASGVTGGAATLTGEVVPTNVPAGCELKVKVAATVKMVHSGSAAMTVTIDLCDVSTGSAVVLASYILGNVYTTDPQYVAIKFDETATPKSGTMARYQLQVTNSGANLTTTLERQYWEIEYKPAKRAQR